MVPASSARGGASALRDGSVPVSASIILLALVVAAVRGRGLILARLLRSRLDISADSASLGAHGSVAARAVSATR